MSRAIAFSSSANLGPGFDVVALAHTAYFDEARVVHLDKSSSLHIELLVRGPYADMVGEPNTASYALKKLLETRGRDVYIVVELWKGIPVSAGLGGSAASSVAVIAAASTALGINVTPLEAAVIAGEAERFSAGTSHYDNASASAFGGLVVITSMSPLRVYKTSIPGMKFVVATPMKTRYIHRKTEFMRKLLPRRVELKALVENSSKLSALLLGLILSREDLLLQGFGESFIDEIRARHVPCYYEVKARLAEIGKPIAISGAGPSIITYCTSMRDCSRVEERLKTSYRDCSVPVVVKTADPAPSPFSALHR